MPAFPATLSTPPKWFFVVDEVEEKFTFTVCIVRLWRDVQDVVVGAAILELRRHVDARALLGLSASAGGSSAAATTAAATTAAAPASTSRVRREVLRHAQAHVVAGRRDRVGVMEVP